MSERCETCGQKIRGPRRPNTRLGALIAGRGFTHYKIGEELGVGGGTVTAWCNGRNFPRSNKTLRLAALLGTDAGTILSMIDSPKLQDDES